MKSVTAFLAAALIAAPTIAFAADATTGKVNKVDAAKHVANLLIADETESPLRWIVRHCAPRFQRQQPPHA